MIPRAEPVWPIPMPEAVPEIDVPLCGYARSQQAPAVPEPTLMGAETLAAVTRPLSLW